MRFNGPSPEYIDFDGYAGEVEGLGPGQRVAIWVRGCTRQCPGCIAPELWKPGEEPALIDDVVNMLEGPLSTARGLTVTGGEPFEQAEAVASLVTRLRERIPVEVLVYTGYRIEELRVGPPAWRDLLSIIDILVDGPYLEGEPNTLIWRGSDNQRVHLLTPGSRRYAGVEDAKMPHARHVSLQMLSPTKYRLIGIPGRGDLERLRRLLLERGLEMVQDERPRR